MSKPKDQRKLKIPARIVDGILELKYGGAVPLVDGAHLEISVQERFIKDSDFVHDMRRRKSIRVLPEGTKLLAVLSARGSAFAIDLNNEQMPYFELIDRVLLRLSGPFEYSSPVFVELRVGPMDEAQIEVDGLRSGGIWLNVEGPRAVGLQSSLIELPNSIHQGFASSLNHALTLLSEWHETWRISHTGNVYEQIFYEEDNGYWYPLKYLRDDELVEEEQKIAHALWQRFLYEMTSMSN